MALVSEEPKFFKAQYRVKDIIQNLILKAFTTGNIRNFLFLKLEDSARYGGFLIAPAKGFIRGFLAVLAYFRKSFVFSSKLSNFL